jgi:hypothetical protein
LTARRQRALNRGMRGEELLQTLRQAAAGGGPVAAMLRHAARHPIADPREPHLAELTTEGCAAAEEFGTWLGEFGRVRLFHSPVKRCRQTIDCIAVGARRVGVTVEIVGEYGELGIDYIRNVPEAGRLSVVHGEGFVRHWFAGTLPPGVVDPVDVISERKVAYIRRHLATAQPGTLDLHCSHDWNIMVLREHLCAVRHEDAGWLTFLDGVTFAPSTRGVRAIYRDVARELAG